MLHEMNRWVVQLACFALILSGCSADPKHVEQDFGNSVRQMVAAQIYDPVVASNPVEEPPELLDGTGASESVIGYRESAKRSSPRNQQTSGVNVQIE